MRKILTRTVAVFAAASAALTPLAAKAPAAKPALWKVADKDTTIYLFGTIHLLPKGTEWRTAKFNQAAASSSTLVVETIIDEANPAAAIGAMMKLAVSPNLPPILDRVTPDKRPALAAMIARSGMPAGVLDKLETWAGGMILLGVTFKDLGLEPSSGVETALRSEFKTAAKSIDQLETNAEQFGFFDTLPEAAQRKFLESVTDDPAKGRAMFTEMLSVWTRGDVKAMGDSFNRELKDSPELRENLLRKRNANWNGWVQRRMLQPGTVFVAVGAGHLAGSDSVISMLERSGYKVKRVQ
ncbi:TraB/GumN family protein [Sphingomonas sp.]|uniref:TraB/GumN family protein n=1 Tax=Sphingomonas sp. TaxID=28214 RepID=UPI00286AB5F1|nr:TraB/GumN family protein [Sphingomonas sp.]